MNIQTNRKLVVAFVIAVFVLRSGEAEALVVDLVVDSSQSNVTIDVDAGFIAGSDSQTSAISGTSVIDLSPAFDPFETAEITALELTLDDGLTFNLNFGLSATSSGGNITVTQIASGGATSVSEGLFTQTSNTLAIAGTVTPSVGGTTINLSEYSPLSDVDYEDASITQAGSTITLNTPFNATLPTIPVDTGVIGVIDIDISLSGNVVATGTALKLGDLNLSGTVDSVDLDLFVENWRADTTGLTELEAFQLGDMNFDGVTSLADFSLFRTGYSADNPGMLLSLTDIALEAVPEPSSAVAVTIGLIVFSACRRSRAS